MPPSPKTPPNGLGKIGTTAIIFFLVFIVLSLGITYWAARRTRTTSDFFVAGGGITAWQNGFALAGDFMSAASFLGIAGLVAKSGFDGLMYSTGFLVGWPLVLFLIAESLRAIGKYTFADVVAYRLRQKPVRIAAAFGTVAVVMFYLIAQMVGAGKLIQLMFGQSYAASIRSSVGVIMMVYVLFGGMIATTWVQIIKAGPAARRGDADGRDGAGEVRLQPAGALRRRRPAVQPRRRPRVVGAAAANRP